MVFSSRPGDLVTVSVFVSSFSGVLVVMVVDFVLEDLLLLDDFLLGEAFFFPLAGERLPDRPRLLDRLRDREEERLVVFFF